jgi:hypothetical protein
MTDRLYLSLWFANFRFAALPDAVLSVLRQFPFSPAMPGIRAAAAYPLDWNEANVYQRIWEADEISEESPEILHSQLERAVREAMEALHEDYAYEFEIYWDLWTPAADEGKWERRPALVKLAALGPEFDEAAFEQTGNIRIDLGLDTAFLHSELALDQHSLEHVQDNNRQLIEFTLRIEKHCNVSSRLLWSDDDSTLAQKLIERLQKLN